jgi:uncharacterized protein
MSTTCRRLSVIGFVAGTYLSLVAAGAFAKGPSFDCSKATTDIEQMICQDDTLSALDRKLAHYYSEASRRYPTSAPPRLKKEDVAWQQKLNECSNSADQRECIQTTYMTRIAEVQASNDLVSGKAQTFRCKNEAGSESSLLATFHQTDPPTATFQRADQRVLAVMHTSDNQTRYEGPDLSFQHGPDSVRIVWRDDQMSCLSE